MTLTEGIQNILNGNAFTQGWFKKQYKIIVLVCGLIFIYIYCGFKSQAQYHHLTELRKELKDAQYELLTRKTTLTMLCKESSLMPVLRERGSQLESCQEAVIRVR